jgi:hypothetical protein
MINQEVLNKMREQYEKAKALAEKAWEDGDHEGNIHDQYYFEAGFIAALAWRVGKDKE